MVFSSAEAQPHRGFAFEPPSDPLLWRGFKGGIIETGFFILKDDRPPRFIAGRFELRPLDGKDDRFRKV
jgi:hypothetical protein